MWKGEALLCTLNAYVHIVLYLFNHVTLPSTQKQLLNSTLLHPPPKTRTTKISFGVLKEAKHTTNRYSRVGVFNDQGFLKGSERIMLEEDDGGLRVAKVGGVGGGWLNITSPLNLEGNKLKGAKLEKGTVVSECIWSGGSIENTVLTNVTAFGLDLGDVELNSVKVEDLNLGKGNILIAGEDGKIDASNAVRVSLLESADEVSTSGVLGDDSSSKANSRVLEVRASVDFKGNAMRNLNIVSGKIGGGGSSSNGANGSSGSGDVLDISGNVKVSGIMNFGGSSGNSESDALDGGTNIDSGEIRGAKISGGTASDLNGLSVKGGVDFQREVYIGGELTVGGSVVGSGPYVDASDARLKENVKPLKSAESGYPDALQSIMNIEAVTYNRVGSEDLEIGFIAQQVQEFMPALVHDMNIDDGKNAKAAVNGDKEEEDSSKYKGVKYSRFVPLLLEGYKQISLDLKTMQKELDDVRGHNKILIDRIERLEGMLDYS